MVMIKEDYVSFETAKLLKSKKFHIPTRSHYDGRGGFGFLDICEIDWNNYKCFKERRCYSAPTHQMARKWLRKMYNINIDIVPVWNQKRFEYQVFIVTPENAKHCYVDEKLYLGYEEAAEAGIKYSLENLI